MKTTKTKWVIQSRETHACNERAGFLLDSLLFLNTSECFSLIDLYPGPTAATSPPLSSSSSSLPLPCICSLRAAMTPACVECSSSLYGWCVEGVAARWCKLMRRSEVTAALLIHAAAEPLTLWGNTELRAWCLPHTNNGGGRNGASITVRLTVALFQSHGVLESLCFDWVKALFSFFYLLLLCIHPVSLQVPPASINNVFFSL